MVQFLILNGSNVHAKDSDNYTPMDLAKQKNMKNTISLLKHSLNFTSTSEVSRPFSGYFVLSVNNPSTGEALANLVHSAMDSCSPHLLYNRYPALPCHSCRDSTCGSALQKARKLHVDRKGHQQSVLHVGDGISLWSIHMGLFQQSLSPYVC